MKSESGLVIKNKKSRIKEISKFIAGAGFYLFVGISLMLFVYISSRSKEHIDYYQNYTKKILAEIERHELLKHQIAQGSLIIDKENKKDLKNNKDKSCKKENIQDDKSKVNNSSKNSENCEPIEDNKETVTTKVFRNDEIIKLDNAVIKNDTYTIVTTFDFSKSEQIFSKQNQLCNFVKFLAPEMKENIFTTVKIGDYLVRKNTKIKNEEKSISKDCNGEAEKIVIETKFYPKDLNTSPTQTQSIISPVTTNEVKIQ